MQILIATHGTMAEGILSAASIIMGNMEDVHVLNAYVDDQSLQKKMDAFFEKIKDPEILVLTDMFGGSVNQALMPYIQSHKITLVSGVNLPCVLEILSKREQITMEELKSIVEESRKQIMVVNELLNTMDTTDDFD